MNLPLRIRREAVEDIEAATAWYEGKLPGLGDQFGVRLQAVFERIQQNPQLHAVTYSNVRQTMLRKFPYVVCYISLADAVEVIAAYHTSRDPESWKSRAE